MRKYIFITTDIHPLGGMQIYISGKSKYLESIGWNVYVIYPSFVKGKCVFPQLNKYISGRNISMSFYPGELSSGKIKKTLRWVRNYIDYSRDDEVLIESNHDKSAIWGEIIAKDLNAKHACLCCNEIFRGPYKHYEEYLEFFKFKYDRNELAGISRKSLPLLFENSEYQIQESNDYVFSAAADEPVQDVEFPQLKEFDNKRVKIAYIGRVSKEPFREITKSVKDFVLNYPKIEFSYVVVGDANNEEREWVEKEFLNLNNCNCIFTGTLAPVPQKLFTCINVVIAGSGCALMATKQGVLTILVDALDSKSNGVLGIDTMDFLFRVPNGYKATIQQTLREILIDHKYNSTDIQPLVEKKREDIYKQHFIYFNREKKYFSSQKLMDSYGNKLENKIRYFYNGIIRNYIYLFKREDTD